MENTQQLVSRKEIEKYTKQPDLSPILELLPPEQREPAIASIQQMNARIEQAFLDQLTSNPEVTASLERLFTLIDSETELQAKNSMQWQSNSLLERVKLVPEIVQNHLAITAAKFATSRFLEYSHKKALEKIESGYSVSKEEAIALLDDVNQILNNKGN